MIKKKLVTAALMGVVILSMAACGKEQTAPVSVVSANEVTSTETSEPTEEPEVTQAPEDDTEEESDAPLEVTPEEMGGQDEESTEDDADAVIAAKEADGYDASAMLEGTQVGVSGSNVYVMVDGKGLLYDFDGYGLASIGRVEDAVTSAYGLQKSGTYRFEAYYGGLADKYKGKQIDDIKIGDMTLNCYWDADMAYFIAYCKSLDCAITVNGDLDWDSDELLEAIKATIAEDVKFFDATSK